MTCGGVINDVKGLSMYVHERSQNRNEMKSTEGPAQLRDGPSPPAVLTMLQ